MIWKKKLVSCLLILTATLWHASAGAYVLPGLHLMDLMTRHMGKARALEVSQRLVHLPDEASMPEVVLRETLIFRYPNAIRLESASDNLHRILLSVEGAVLTIRDERRVPSDESLWDQYKDILVYRSRDALQERLGRNGLDVMTSSLGRFQGRPCYVLGAQYPDISRPQIWIEKETFFPSRWLIPESSPEGSHTLLEFRYLDWQKRGRLWYPMHIQFIQNERLVREIFVESLQVNATLDDSLFDMEYMKNIYPVSEPTGSDTKPLEEPSEIQKTIEDFKRRFQQSPSGGNNIGN